jgi:protein TonB
MLETLLESRGVKAPPSIGGAVLSAVTHGAIIVALIFGSGHVSDVLDRLDQTLTFLIPPDRAPPPTQTDLSFASIGGGRNAPGVETNVRRESANGAIRRRELGGAQAIGESAVASAATGTPDNAYSIIEVDSLAVVDFNSAAPSYPKDLMEKGIEGYAAMRFVVDSTGKIDLGTVQTIEATNPGFVTAVREAMPGMHFRPAKMGDHPVRQLAEQMFKFQIQRTAPAVPAVSPPAGGEETVGSTPFDWNEEERASATPRCLSLLRSFAFVLLTRIAVRRSDRDLPHGGPGIPRRPRQRRPRSRTRR